MSDIVQIAIAAFAFLGTLAGIVKLHMDHKFKLSMKLIQAEESKNKRSIVELGEVVAAIRATLTAHQAKMDVLMGQLRINKDALDRTQQAQIAFIAEAQKKFKALEDVTEKIGKVTLKP